MRPFTRPLKQTIDKLISEFIDDAGDRLKKSKMSGMRTVKQTLRFGRRSDPTWFTAGPADQTGSMSQGNLWPDSDDDDLERQRYFAMQ